MGENGPGDLQITNGASVSDFNASVGANSGTSGTVTVSGTGSQWLSMSSVFVGQGGSGVLTVNNGATFFSSNTILGSNLGGNGIAVIDGTGTSATGVRAGAH